MLLLRSRDATADRWDLVCFIGCHQRKLVR